MKHLIVFFTLVFACSYASEEIIKDKFEMWSYVNETYSPDFTLRVCEYSISKNDYKIFMFAYSKGRIDAYREIFLDEKNTPLYDVLFGD